MEEIKKDQNMVSKKKNFNTNFFYIVESNLFRDGKRASAERNTFKIFKQLKCTRKRSIVSLSEELVDSINPSVSLSSKRVAGSVYRIPVFLALQKRVPLCAKWLVRSSCLRKTGPRYSQLLKEFELALANQGAAVQKRKALQATAVANRAYVRYSR